VALTAGGIVGRAIDLGVRCQLFIAAYLAAVCAYLSASFDGSIDRPAVAVTFLTSWQAYAADRFIIHPEDAAGTDEDLDRVRFLRRHPFVFRVLFLLSLALEAWLVATVPWVAGGLCLGIGLGLLYVVDLPLLRKRLKCVPYAKAFYVPFAAVATMLLLLGRFPADGPTALRVLGVYLLMGLNVVVFDIKDRESDLRAGIRTLANALGARSVVRAVQLACLLTGAGLILLDPRAVTVALGLSFWSFSGLLRGLSPATERSGRFYFCLLDLGLAFPLLFLALSRLLP
jgi:hypothetical protein